MAVNRVYLAQSTDGGVTFGEPVLVSGEDGYVTPGSTAQVSGFGPDGAVHVAYLSAPPSDVSEYGREIVVVARSDDGRSIAAPIEIPHDEEITNSEGRNGVYCAVAEAAGEASSDPIALLEDEWAPVTPVRLAPDEQGNAYIAFIDAREEAPRLLLYQIAPDGAAMPLGPQDPGWVYPTRAAGGDALALESIIEQFAADIGVTFTLLHDSKNTFSRTFRTTGVPETLLIGRDGEVLYRWKGSLQDGAADHEIIQAAPDGAASGIVAPVAQIAMPVAFVAGLLSFLSPCVLPLIPTYAGVITGFSMKELSSPAPEARQRIRRATFTNGLLFVAGFSAVFIALGASATLLGGWLIEYCVWIARIGGVILLVLGLHLQGLLRIPWLNRTIRTDVGTQRTGRAGAFLIGVAFGAGWTPCIGPALAGILTIAAATASVREGVTLAAVYSLGLAIPFPGATVAVDRSMSSSGRFRRWLPRLQQASGVLVLIVAALLLTDSTTRLSELVTRFEG